MRNRRNDERKWKESKRMNERKLKDQIEKDKWLTKLRIHRCRFLQCFAVPKSSADVRCSSVRSSPEHSEHPNHPISGQRSRSILPWSEDLKTMPCDGSWGILISRSLSAIPRRRARTSDRREGMMHCLLPLHHSHQKRKTECHRQHRSTFLHPNHHCHSLHHHHHWFSFLFFLFFLFLSCGVSVSLPFVCWWCSLSAPISEPSESKIPEDASRTLSDDLSEQRDDVRLRSQIFGCRDAEMKKWRNGEMVRIEGIEGIEGMMKEWRNEATKETTEGWGKEHLGNEENEENEALQERRNDGMMEWWNGGLKRWRYEKIEWMNWKDKIRSNWIGDRGKLIRVTKKTNGPIWRKGSNFGSLGVRSELRWYDNDVRMT